MKMRIDGSDMRAVIGRIVLLLALAWAGFAQALGPVEQPPQDYASDQYIDSAGCVYRRQGSVWAPRLDGDGAVICGYPPSLPAHVTAKPVQPDDAALRLAVTLADGLQDSDILANPPATLRRETVTTPKPTSGRLAKLDQAVATMPAMRQATAAGAGGKDGRMCDLLGYAEGAGIPGGGAGQATLGYCSGPTTALQPKVGAGDAADQRVTAADAPAAAGRALGRPQGAADARPATAKPQARVTVETAGVKGVDPALVPPNARFVQIGHFANAALAEAAIRRLSGLGYPVVRGVRSEDAAGGRVIMAGPFGDRRSVIAALNHLHAQGYPKAFAR